MSYDGDAKNAARTPFDIAHACSWRNFQRPEPWVF